MTRVSANAASIAAGAIVCVLANGAVAQTTESKRDGQQQPAAAQDAVQLEEISVTATRQPTQVLEVPGTVSVITRQQLDEHQVRNAQDLVRYEPGVNVARQTSGTDPFGNLGSFTIRGVSGNRVQIQVDGSRIQEQISDGNRAFFDFPGLKAVEIQRGPGSVLWGADALGGIVSFRTLDPADLLGDSGKLYAGRVETNFDSFDKRFGKTGMAAFQLTPDLQALVMLNQSSYHEGKLSKARADGGIWGCPRGADAIRCDELNPLDGRTWNSLAKLVWTPTDDHEFKLTGEIFDSHAKVSQLYDYGLQTTGTFNGDYDRKQDQTRKRIAFSHKWDVGAPWLDQLRWQVSYSPQRRDVNSDRLQTSAAGVTTRTVDQLKYDEKFLQGDLQLTSLAEFAGMSHRFTYGFQGDFTKTDYFRESAATNLSTGVTTITRAGGFNFANAETTRADLYAQDEIKLFADRLTITPGVRWANYKIDPHPNSDYVVVPGLEPRKLDSSRLIPQVGGLFRLTEEFSVYARYAEGFKMPTAQQLFTSLPSTTFTLIPNPNLRPEKVKSYEAGLRGQFKTNEYFERAWFSAGMFKSDYTDFIQSFVEVGPNEYSYRNLSSVDIWGVEASAEVQFNDRWSVNGSLSWQRGDQRAQAGAKKTPFDGAIPLVGVLGVKWRDPGLGLELEGVGTFAQGVKRISDDSLFKPGGYAVFDMFATWTPRISGWGPIESITFRGAVLNIFDKRYFKGPMPYSFALTPTTSTAISNPLELQTAPGRTFRVSAAINF